MSQLVFDEAAARRIEALYRIGDAVRRRGLVRAALRAATGERILDVGCGPGYYCAELLQEVGPSGEVVGVDGSPAMLELAARRCAEHDNVEFHEADATSLPVSDGSFDGVLCVPGPRVRGRPDRGPGPDAPGAAAGRTSGGLGCRLEHRVASLPGPRTYRCRCCAPGTSTWHTRSLPRTLGTRLRAAGFEDVRMEAHAFATSEFDSDGYGPALIPFIGDFVAGRQGISEEEAQAWVAEQRELGQRGEFYFASTQCCFTAVKPE